MFIRSRNAKRNFTKRYARIYQWSCKSHILDLYLNHSEETAHLVCIPRDGALKKASTWTVSLALLRGLPTRNLILAGVLELLPNSYALGGDLLSSLRRALRSLHTKVNPAPPWNPSVVPSERTSVNGIYPATESCKSRGLLRLSGVTDESQPKPLQLVHLPIDFGTGK